MLFFVYVGPVYRKFVVVRDEFAALPPGGAPSVVWDTDAIPAKSALFPSAKSKSVPVKSISSDS